MSDAPSTKLTDGAAMEGDANGVLGMHAVDDPIKPGQVFLSPLKGKLL